MQRFFTLQYLLSVRPEPAFAFTKLTLFVVILLMGGALAVRLIRRRKVKDEIWKKILRPYPSTLFNFGLALLMLLFFREMGVPYLSMRVWWVFLGFLFLYSLGKFFVGFKKEYQKRAEGATSMPVAIDTYPPKNNAPCAIQKILIK